MKTSVKLLALFFLTLAFSGCASTCPKCECPSPKVPVTSTPVVAAQPVTAPVAEPVAETVPVAARQYVSK